MGRLRVYLSTFTEAGDYDDYVEITEDVIFNSMGDIRQALDDEEYNVGVFKVADFKLQLRNEHGRYSDVGEEKTIFRYQRADSLVKIVWDKQNYPPMCGVVKAGETIAGNESVELYEGLLNDDSAETEIKSQIAEFRILGKDHIFARTETELGHVDDGMTVSEILLAILSVSKISEILNVDAPNIDPGVDAVIDLTDEWLNTTVKEALDDLLQISNSVLYIIGVTVYIKPRDANPALAATFYGQASNEGIENIIEINQIKSGLSTMFNMWTWEDTTLVSRDTESITQNGVRKKEIGFDQVTNNTTRQAVLDALKTEFGTEKRSLNIVVPITEEFLALFLLDRVTIDYPTVFYAADEQGVPVYGVAIYGEARWPVGEWSLTLNTDTEWKILGRQIKTKTQLIEFRLREI